MAVLGYIEKLKRFLGVAFSVHFLHGFSVKMFLNSLLMNKVSAVSHLISFSRYQANRVIT